MKLVREIRDGATDSTMDLSTVLRKAKILAATLGNKEFKEWVSYELNGYPAQSETPDYRQISSPPLGDFIGYGSKISGYILPVSQMPDLLRENAFTIRFPNSIKEIESMAQTGGDNLRHPWPAEAVMLLREHIQLTGGYVLIDTYQPISRAQLEAIADAVRNRLLDFLLALQEINPLVLESEDALRDLPKDIVNQVFHVSVSGNHNVLATGSGFSQAVTQVVSRNDQTTLLAHLRQIGVSDDDLDDLRSALEMDGERPPGDFGERVKTWMGRAIVKAMNGSLKVAVTAAPEILMKALSAYYGW
jgi:hypothetical protein